MPEKTVGYGISITRSLTHLYSGTGSLLGAFLGFLLGLGRASGGLRSLLFFTSLRHR